MMHDASMHDDLYEYEHQVLLPVHAVRRADKLKFASASDIRLVLEGCWCSSRRRSPLISTINAHILTTLHHYSNFQTPSSAPQTPQKEDPGPWICRARASGAPTGELELRETQPPTTDATVLRRPCSIRVTAE
jgi:hypothetical protein